MKKWTYRITLGILSCSLAAALPAFAQDNQPQQNDHPEHQKQTQRQEQNSKTRTETHTRAKAQQEHNARQPQTQRAEHNYPQQQPNRSARPSPNRTQQYQANQRRPNRGRPAQWGRPPARRGSYRWRSNDRSRLHSYYMARLRAINRANRPVFRVGGYFPYVDIEYLSPLPPDLYGTLPPPPPGYQMGYYDGYVVVYDPVTYFIASVIDLLQ